MGAQQKRANLTQKHANQGRPASSPNTDLIRSILLFYDFRLVYRVLRLGLGLYIYIVLFSISGDRVLRVWFCSPPRGASRGLKNHTQSLFKNSSLTNDKRRASEPWAWHLFMPFAALLN